VAGQILRFGAPSGDRLRYQVGNDTGGYARLHQRPLSHQVIELAATGHVRPGWPSSHPTPGNTARSEQVLYRVLDPCVCVDGKEVALRY